MKSILDPTFRYTSSANTDLRKTFARIRRESRRQAPHEPKTAAVMPRATRGRPPVGATRTPKPR